MFKEKAMLRTCYHILSNHTNEYARTLEEVQSRIAELNTNGENHIKISQVFTEEDFDVDAIRLKEVNIPIADVDINTELIQTELV